MASWTPANPSPVVFFDGVCNLCNGFVDWAMRQDSQGQLLFASLQGSTARKLLKGHLSEKDWLRSVVVWHKGQIWIEDEAVIYILRNLGGGWKALAVLRWLPGPLRRVVYGWVARNRYRWFGQRETCRLPSPSEAARFLP